MKYAFLLNPVANSSRALAHHMWLRKEVEKNWPESSIVFTQSADNVKEQTRQLAANFDVIVACGGDGTLHQVAEGLMHTQAIGAVLPLGSGNDFAKALGVSRKVSVAMQQLVRSVPIPLDMIRYQCDHESGFFNNTLGIGFDGWANAYAHSFGYLKGHLKYSLAAIQTIRKHGPFSCSIWLDGIERKGRFLMITLANGPAEGGNFNVVPHASPFDGHFDVLLVKPLTKAGLFLRLPFFLLGWHTRFNAIEFHKVKQIQLQTETEVAVHADGEQIGSGIRTVNAEIIPGAIRFLVPEKSTFHR